MKKGLLLTILLGASMATVSANVEEAAKRSSETETMLLKCCTASNVDAETGEVVSSVTVCGGDSDAEYILSCNRANGFLKTLEEAPE